MTDASAKVLIDAAWAEREPGEVVLNKDASFIVATGDGAQMSCPTGELIWQLTWGDPEKVRYIAASVIESYDYLLRYPNKEEAWRRIKILRDALRMRNN